MAKNPPFNSLVWGSLRLAPINSNELKTAFEGVIYTVALPVTVFISGGCRNLERGVQREAQPKI